MVYTGQPSRGCATCRKRRIKCDEKTPACGNCFRIHETCPGYKDQFDLAWRDQTTVAKKGVERGKQKRRAAREKIVAASSSSSSSSSSSFSQDPAQDSSRSSRSSSASDAQDNNDARLAGTESHDAIMRGALIPSRSRGVPRALKVQEAKDPSTSTTWLDPHLGLRVTPEDRTLSYFLNSYILPVRDPLARRGFLEYLGPLYTHADPQSPFMLSTMAVAACMLSTRMGQDPNTTFARSFYLRAVKTMRDQVSEQKGCANDEMLIAVLLLHMYEVSEPSSPISDGRLMVSEAFIARGFWTSASSHAHLDGALALIRYRGIADFKGKKVSEAIILYVRSLLIGEAYGSNSAVPRDVAEWAELVGDSEKIPGVTLDTINLDLANLRASAAEIHRAPAVNPRIRASQIQYLLNTATDIDRRLTEWCGTIPKSWIPIRVSGEKYIAPSIKEAGLYQDYCEIYGSVFLCSSWSRFRLLQIEVRKIRLSCLAGSEKPSAANLAQQEADKHSIQQLVDDICASVPFYLGDRTEPGVPGDPRVRYPRAPGKPPIRDHYQTGPTMGGWSLLAPLGSLMRLNIKLREGQKLWIKGQIARTARVYMVRRLPGQSPQG